ncbi:MAG TPA: STAS domain-containing protein [Solirubrobacteraceae bacterium]|jgi:anti-anti-sigma factor|nr:STAS domain-containing protein [Solirubrobacteraceae bacterium]
MGAGDLTIARDDRGDLVVLALHGELDRAGADKLLADAAGVPLGGELVLDLAALHRLDPDGLRALTNLDVRSRVERWSLALTGLRPEVADVLAAAGLDQRIDVRDSAP